MTEVKLWKCFDLFNGIEGFDDEVSISNSSISAVNSFNSSTRFYTISREKLSYGA